MASPSELSLDYKPAHSYSMLLKSFGDHHFQQQPAHDQTHKLEDFLNRLEEERLKIDAFKRELPLCMQLLTNGIYTYIHTNNLYNIFRCMYIFIHICISKYLNILMSNLIDN